MASAHDVARALIERQSPMDTWKLQKLVYYCQAWHLVRRDRPLFPERIEAWAGGPVVPELYRVHRGDFSVDSWPTGDSGNLGKSESKTVEVVFEAYGSLTGRQLRVLTHKESPWRIAREGLEPGERSNNTISLVDMLNYYSGVAASDEATPIQDLVWWDPDHKVYTGD